MCQVHSWLSFDIRAPAFCSILDLELHSNRVDGKDEGRQVPTSLTNPFCLPAKSLWLERCAGNVQTQWGLPPPLLSVMSVYQTEHVDLAAVPMLLTGYKGLLACRQPPGTEGWLACPAGSCLMHPAGTAAIHCHSPRLVHACVPLERSCGSCLAEQPGA